MDSLPNEIISCIALESGYRDIIRFSQINRRIYDLCMNVKFWEEKSLKEFGINLISVDELNEPESSQYPFVKTKLTSADLPNDLIRRYLETESKYKRSKGIYTMYFDEIFSRLPGRYYQSLNTLLNNRYKFGIMPLRGKPLNVINDSNKSIKVKNDKTLTQNNMRKFKQTRSRKKIVLEGKKSRNYAKKKSYRH